MHRDLRALARFPRNRPDHHRAVINFRYFGLEQMLDQFRSGARSDHARTLHRFFHTHDHHSNPLADRERFQPRLLLASHARFGLADIENHIRTFEPLHGRIHDLVHMTDVLVVNRVTFRFAHFLKYDLLRQLRRNPTQNSFRHFRDEQLSAGFRARIQLPRLLHRHLQIRIFHLLRSLDDRLHRIGIDLAAIFVEHRAQVFLRLVVFARGHHNGVLDRAHYNLRINAFFPADPFDDVVKLTSHKKSRCQVSGLRSQDSDFGFPET